MRIELKFNRKDFEELYFINGRGSYIKDEVIKSSFRNLLISGFVSMGLYIYSIVKSNYDLFFFSLIFLAIFFFVYIGAAKNVKKWRLQIKNYLDAQEKYSKHVLVANDDYLSIVQNDEETIEKWTNIERVKIFDSHIWILGIENFLIPAKSMSKKEYAELRGLISKKFK